LYFNDMVPGLLCVERMVCCLTILYDVISSAQGMRSLQKRSTDLKGCDSGLFANVILAFDTPEVYYKHQSQKQVEWLRFERRTSRIQLLDLYTNLIGCDIRRAIVPLFHWSLSASGQLQLLTSASLLHDMH
jgi:hypothetical protein